jgi:hypothetical protein
MDNHNGRFFSLGEHRSRHGSFSVSRPNPPIRRIRFEHRGTVQASEITETTLSIPGESSFLETEDESTLTVSVIVGPHGIRYIGPLQQAAERAFEERLNAIYATYESYQLKVPYTLDWDRLPSDTKEKLHEKYGKDGITLECPISLNSVAQFPVRIIETDNDKTHYFYFEWQSIQILMQYAKAQNQLICNPLTRNRITVNQIQTVSEEELLVLKNLHEQYPSEIPLEDAIQKNTAPTF